MAFDFESAVVASGGMGDMILTLGVLEGLEEKIGPFQVFCTYPEAYTYFTGKSALPAQDFKPGMARFGMDVNIYARPYTQNSEEPYASLLKEIWGFIEAFELDHYLRHHPYKDGDGARALIQKGFNRFTVLPAMLGLSETELFKRTPGPSMIDGEYITVHDGVGLNHLGKVERATKAWDIGHWATLIQLIKQEHPSLPIVQLGSGTSRKIPGVDYALADSLPIGKSFDILGHSLLHIDGESGLVHAARSMGVRSVVLFGPTPIEFFGHPENINIRSQVCRPCWWMDDLWVKRCPLGYKAPICMNSINPDRVMEGVRLGMKASSPSPSEEGQVIRA